MATLTHAKSKRLYSWWWDSHISPKNSKWLQENLTDMDAKVKSMIKLIEEDADSFARRAEMYYKKRPELMKLVEEFYRAYRALAERYDHATGALRQAHRTMAEAFPNQMPFALIDDSSPSSSVVEGEPHTPEMPPPLPAFSEPDDLHRDALSQSLYLHSNKRNGSCSDENDASNSKRELKKLNEKFADGKIRRGLSFQEEEGKEPEHRIHGVSGDIQKNKVGNKKDAYETTSLQDEISQLSTENQKLRAQIKSELHIVHRLQESLLKSEVEKEAALLQYHKSMEKASDLEMEISHPRVGDRKLESEMLITVARSESPDSAEKRCSLLETDKQALAMEVKCLVQQMNQQQQELIQKHDEMERLKIYCQEEHVQYTQAVASLQSLEKLHSEYLEKLRVSSLEIQNQVEMLRDMEMRKHSLEEDIKLVKEANVNLKRELRKTQEELEMFNISMQGERMVTVQTEEALRSLQDLHSQSEEEIKTLAFDLESKIEMLKDKELKQHSLEEEIQQLNEQKENLNSQVLSSTLMVNNLHQEIFSLNETRLKLENDVKQHLHGNEALQQEVHYLKEEIANLDLKYQHVMEQIESVGLNKESFQTSIKELQDGNLELKELCRKHEDENAILFEKLRNMERVIENNTILETSLSGANAELEGLRVKVKALEESSESLNSKISDLISENGSLVFQLETILKNMENLSENNTFLGNSLTEASVELEGLRGRLKSLEELSQSLLNENANLQSENNTLVLQVEKMGISLDNMERNYEELEDKHLYLEQEKESTLLLVSELQNLLKLEKQEHEAFVLSSNNQLATLTEEMGLLQVEGQIKDEEIESTQHNLLNLQIEAFMLLRCLLDSKEKNLSLERECQKHLEASRLAERLLSQLEKENLRQNKMIASISEHNKRLREAIQIVLNFLGVKNACMSGGTMDEADCQHILGQIKDMQNSISGILDENHFLFLEKIVNNTLLQQLGLDHVVLQSENNALNHQCRSGTEQLLAFEGEKNELLQINEQLQQDILASYLREDILKTERDTLGKQLLDLMEENKKLQGDNCNLVEEKQSLKKNFLKLRNEMQVLEKENNALVTEAVTLSFLSLVLEEFAAERTMDLRVCSSDLVSLHDVNNDLDNKVAQMIQKIEMVEAENKLLKDSTVKLEDCQDHLLILQNDLNMARSVHQQLNLQIEQLSQQIETEKGLLVQKDLDLTEANHKLKVTESENMKLHKDLESLKMEFDEAMYTREELEKSICMLRESSSHKDKEMASIQEENEMLGTEVNTLIRELAVVRTSKEHLTSELAYEIKSYEEQVERLWDEIHVSSVYVGIFEEKLLELIGECESLEIVAIVQRNMLEEKIILDNAYAHELKHKVKALESESERLKTHLNVYIHLVLSLQGGAASLEDQILSLVKHRGMGNDSGHDSSSVRLKHQKSCEQLPEDPSYSESEGILGLQMLQVKLEALRKVLVENWDILMQQNPKVNVKSAAMETELEAVAPEKTLGEEKIQENRLTSMELEDKIRESGKHPKLQSEGAGGSNGAYELMMKDIQLDHASCDVDSSLYKTDKIEIFQDDGQMLELWETAEKDFDIQMMKATSVTAAVDMDCRQTEAIEEEMSQHVPSKLATEEEAGVSKLEVPTPRKMKDSHKDWSKKILESLASDAHRLSVLQKSVQELKHMLENSEKSGPSTNMKYDTVKRQLEETEESILKLFDINKKLTKKAEDVRASSDSNTGEQDEVRNRRKRQVSGRARRGSEKIGRLELELQRIQYVLLNLDEERGNRTKAAHGRSKVMLRDYLYGRRESHRQKKGHLCGCIQSNVVAD